MEKVVLHATRRNVIGKKVGALRRQGKLPAVIYGRHIEPTPILLDLRDASRILGTLTSSSLITIDVEGTEHAALVREKQRDYLKARFLHVDFQAVSLTEKIRTTVVIELHGISPAVKDYNGVVVAGLSELEVECLPQYLPEKILVDISVLNKIGDGLYVRDIKLPTEVTVHQDADEMVVIVTAAAAEELPVEEGAGAEEPEVIERGKKEEAEE